MSQPIQLNLRDDNTVEAFASDHHRISKIKVILIRALSFNAFTLTSEKHSISHTEFMIFITKHYLAMLYNGSCDQVLQTLKRCLNKNRNLNCVGLKTKEKNNVGTGP